MQAAELRLRVAGTVAALLLFTGAASRAQEVAAELLPKLGPELMKDSQVRPIGPTATGGRIVDVAVHASRPFTLFAASASGGLWKSENNGTTWSCIFDRALSLGDIATFDGDPDVLWLGTGEGNNQRSSYVGNGVWRTGDGGKTWEHLGLEETQHIGRIVTHPTDRQTAYVAALGNLYTRNDERGLYKTVDGGTSWERMLHVSDSIGVADVAIDPRHPDTLYAATYQRLRRAWNFEDAGNSAIYKSVDGGESWKRLGGGLPSGKLGRIGVALFADDPDVVYACIDNQNPRPPKPKEEAAPKEGDAARNARQDEEGPIGGEVYRSTDAGRTWEKRNEKPVSGEPPYYYGQIRVDPHRKDRVWLLGIVVFTSDDGGKAWTQGEVASSLHSDHHALWVDPDQPGRVLLGNDGGLAQSFDDGKTWDAFDNLPIAQFYTVSVDPRRPYNVLGGLQDNGVWSGPSRSRSWAGTTRREWSFIGGGDGMYVLTDPEDPDIVYLESQFGSLQRSDLKSWDTTFIQPKNPDEKTRNRFNWCSPILLSSHNSKVVYFGSQFLWKSLDRGDHWKRVSPDLTTNDPEKVKGNVPHCTLTTISESPRDSDLLLAGTDDGNVQLTQDGGRSWTNLAGRFPGLPDHRWVSRVELSRHDEKSAWVTFSGYREDDFTPWVYRTRDGGDSFEPVVAGLPEGPVNVVRESPRSKDVLFLGSDGGAFFSIDGGDHWQDLGQGLPTVSVLDLVVHPRERDVVLATHGRGFFVVDVTAHEQLAKEVLAAPVHLFEPQDHTSLKNVWSLSDGSGDRRWRAPNPDSGAPIWYWLTGDEKPELTVLNPKGKVVRTLEAKAGKGLHRVVWDLRFDPPKEEKAAPKPEDEKEGKKEEKKDEKPARRRYEPGMPAVEEEESETSPAEAEPAIPDEEIEPGREFEPGEEFGPGDEFEREGGFTPDDPPPRRRGRGGGDSAGPGTWTIRLKLGDQVLERDLHVLTDPLNEVRRRGW